MVKGSAVTGPSNEQGNRTLSRRLNSIRNESLGKPATIVGSVTGLSRDGNVKNVTAGFGFAGSFLGARGKESTLEIVVRIFVRGGYFRVRFGMMDHRSLVGTRRGPRDCRALVMEITNFDSCFMHLNGGIRSRVVHEARVKRVWIKLAGSGTLCVWFGVEEWCCRTYWGVCGSCNTSNGWTSASFQEKRK